MKLRITADAVYDADPDDYGTEDPHEAASLDSAAGVETLIALAEEGEMDITVEPA